MREMETLAHLHEGQYRTPRSEAEILMDEYAPSHLDMPHAVAQREADAAFVAQSETLHGAQPYAGYIRPTPKQTSQGPRDVSHSEIDEMRRSNAKRHQALQELVQERAKEEWARDNVEIRSTHKPVSHYEPEHHPTTHK